MQTMQLIQIPQTHLPDNSVEADADERAVVLQEHGAPDHHIRLHNEHRLAKYQSGGAETKEYVNKTSDKRSGTEPSRNAQGLPRAPPPSRPPHHTPRRQASPANITNTHSTAHKSKQTKKRENKGINKNTTEQNKQTNERTNERTNKPTTQTNNQTNRQVNTSKNIGIELINVESLAVLVEMHAVASAHPIGTNPE